MNDVRFKVVAEHHERDADGNVIEHDDVSEGQVKKELKDLSKASKTLKGKYVAKADEVEEGYQRDPEGGEEKARQQRRSQKGGDRTEKVRGERTPMPPRGDKRREYAFTKSVSKDPKDQDDARKIRVQMDYDDLKKQIGAKKKPQVPANAVVEDKALAAVRASIEKEHGKGAIYDPKKKQSPADKAKVAAERKKRQVADNKAFAGRAKKAGYKNPQDYANVVARYGSEDNYKKGRGLGS